MSKDTDFEVKALKLAGKLASAAREVIHSTPFGLSSRLFKLEDALDEYNNYILRNLDDD